MKLDKCTVTIVSWMKRCGYINLDDLVCERLIADFCDNKVIRSLDWLAKNQLIQERHERPDCEPYILVPGGIEYSSDEWCLSELGKMLRW